MKYMTKESLSENFQKEEMIEKLVIFRWATKRCDKGTALPCLERTVEKACAGVGQPEHL